MSVRWLAPSLVGERRAMYYIGIDPGANYSGIAILNDETFVESGEFANPCELWELAEEYIEYNPTTWTVIEDFLGSGASNTYRKKTVMALGYFQYRCAEIDANYEVVPQQTRLAYVKLVPYEISGKDEKSAAAHALALRERRKRRR